MFTSFVSQWTKRVLNPAIDTRMRASGEAWVAEATARCPVDTGYLKSTITYTYNTSTKTLNLIVDAPYFPFVEWGTHVSRPQPFAIPALSAVPRVWRGGLGSALTGHSTTIQAANVAPKYHARISSYTKRKTGGASLRLGHGRFS